MNSERSFEYCRNIAKSHYENFPVGVFVPGRIRKYVYAIYTFARTADDFADNEKLTKEQRMALLNEFEVKLDNCYNDQFDDPIFEALNITIREFNIPKDLFKSLLFAFKMDVEKDRFDIFEDLIYYSEHSANPIGKLILILSGINGKTEFHLSDSICTALQLTNFWQDITVDLMKNRIYIPLTDMEKYKYTEEELFNKIYNEKFRNLLISEVVRTEELFKMGSHLVLYLKGRLRFEIVLTILGGMKVLEKIKKLNYNVLNSRPKITLIDKLNLLIKSFFIWLFRLKI
jgi:hydroxysqualene synthase